MPGRLLSHIYTLFLRYLSSDASSGIPYVKYCKDVLPAGVEGEKTGGKIGILTREEKLIIPLKYDWISIDTANKVFYVYDGWKVLYGNNKLRFDSSMSGKIGIFDYAGREKFPNILKGITRQKNKYLIVEDAATSKSGV